MDAALAIDSQTGKQRILTGKKADKLHQNTPDMLAQFNFVSLEDKKSPMFFIPEYFHSGFKKKIPGHFRYATGFSKQDHIFSHNGSGSPKHISLSDAVKSGKDILFSLNVNLSYRLPDFSKVKAAQYREFEWKREHKNYISVPIHGAKEAVKTILKIKKLSSLEDVKNRVFVRYRGGVLPYMKFFLGNRGQDLNRLFDDMASLREGVKRGKTRIVGMPRLIRFVPTDTTLREPGSKNIKGNAFAVNGDEKHGCTQLIFSNKNIKETAEFTNLWNNLQDSMLADDDHTGLFVLASPTISLKKKFDEETQKIIFVPDPHWDHMRLVINDIEAQITPPITPVTQNPAP